MKKEILFFVVVAMVASSFLNSNSQPTGQLEVTKLRIENAADIQAKSQQIRTVSTTKSVAKPNEG